MRRIGHVIGGGQSGEFNRHALVFNPATGEQTAELALASVEEVDEAVEVAKAAFEDWRNVSLSKRADIMFAFRALLDEHSADLAAAITAEHGKVLSDAAGEVARGLECVEFACGIPQLLKGGYSAQASRGVDVHEVKQPLASIHR